MNDPQHPLPTFDAAAGPLLDGGADRHDHRDPAGTGPFAATWTTDRQHPSATWSDGRGRA